MPPLPKFLSALSVLAVIVMMTASVGSVDAADEYVLRIKNHQFHPETLRVPAGKRIKLRVYNDDKTAEEFESHDLRREKIIRGNRKATIFVGPLKPGRYHFFGEFHMDTANGYLIAE